MVTLRNVNYWFHLKESFKLREEKFFLHFFVKSDGMTAVRCLSDGGFTVLVLQSLHKEHEARRMADGTFCCHNFQLRKGPSGIGEGDLLLALQ